MLLGKCKTGGPLNLCFMSPNATCCTFPYVNCLPFLVKSYLGFNNFCISGQNILRKFTMHMKLLHPLIVVGGWNFCIASNLLLNGLRQTLLSFMNIVLPMYGNSVLNNWHFFGKFKVCSLVKLLISLLILPCGISLMEWRIIDYP